MMAGFYVEGVKAGRTAPTPDIATLNSAAIAHYPFAGIGSTEYAATVIAERYNLSPAVARKVVELVGIGGNA